MTRSAFVGALLAMFITACGSFAASVTQSPPAASMQVLASSELPELQSVTRVLTVDEPAKDATISGLATKIRSWGYLDGRERTFQGQSRHLSRVVSRSMIFMDPAGASRFVAFVAANSGAFLGGLGEVHALVAQGRSGWIFTPPMCACHMSNPAVVAVLDAGSSVIWLEINGPDATPALLVSLLDPALSEPTTL